VPAGAVQTIDQSKADWVAANREDHRYRAARVLRGARRSNVSGRRDHDYALSHQLGGERRQRRIIAVRPALLDTDIAALDETGCS
jgi:hypothetical protein